MEIVRARHASFTVLFAASLLSAGCYSATDESPPTREELRNETPNQPPQNGAVAPPGDATQVHEEPGTDEGDRDAPPGKAHYTPTTFVDPTTDPPDPQNPPPPPPQGPGPYSNLDPAHVIPKNLLDHAVLYFDANKSQIPNKDYMTIVDFKPHNGKDRFFIIDMKSGAVEKHVVAHGKGSDLNWTGYATTFSNVSGSNQSSLGFAITGDTYSGTHGRSLRLEGLSSTNSNMFDRAIVIHGASYVVEGQAKQGRSLGCFALDEDDKDDIIDKLEGGSLLYADLGS